MGPQLYCTAAIALLAQGIAPDLHFSIRTKEQPFTTERLVLSLPGHRHQFSICGFDSRGKEVPADEAIVDRLELQVVPGALNRATLEFMQELKRQLEAAGWDVCDQINDVYP
jgi:hypothetical protein